MGSRLRDYIKTYDGVVDEESCQNLIDFFGLAESRNKLLAVDVADRQKYTMAPITAMAVNGDAEALKMHKFLSRLCIFYWQKYQKDIGVGDEGRFRTEYDNDDSRAFTESFFLRCYNPHEGFALPNYDARCFRSGNRLASFVLFLNDDAHGTSSFHFDQSVVAPTVTAKSGRLLIYPANWQYPHEEKPPLTVYPRYAIYGHYAWYDPSAIKKSIDDVEATL